MAVSAACGSEDVSSPGVIGGQWFDATVAEDVVSTIDLYPAGFVVRGDGSPVPADEAVDLTGASAGIGPSTSLATNVGNIQVLFNEPLNPDVIQDLVINSTEPVDLENGPFNRQSEFNPGVEDIIPRTGLVDIVRVSTGEHFEVATFYLDNIRRNVSEVTPDVGLQLFPTAILPAGEEFQIRVYAGVIEDRDGNRVRPADRQALPNGIGQPENVGIVTESDGRPIAAVLGFLTDPISVASVTEPSLAEETDLTTTDDPDTFENEGAIVVTFNTEVLVEDPITHDQVVSAGTQGAFTLTRVGNPTPIAFTVIPLASGDLVDEDGAPIPDAEATIDATSVQIVPNAPLPAGRYELRIDAGFTDSFGNADDGAAPQIFEFTVQ